MNNKKEVAWLTDQVVKLKEENEELRKMLLKAHEVLNDVKSKSYEMAVEITSSRIVNP